MKGFPCFAHSLQLATKDALKDTPGVQELLKTARAIVGHYKHSSSARARLISVMEKLGLDLHELVQDVSTRWNSQYDMLQRLLQVKEALSADIVAQAKIDNLNNSQWKMVSGYPRPFQNCND